MIRTFAFVGTAILTLVAIGVVVPEVGRDVEREHVENIQRVFDRFFGAR